MSFDVIRNLDPQGGSQLFEPIFFDILKFVTTHQPITNSQSRVATTAMPPSIKLRELNIEGLVPRPAGDASLFWDPTPSSPSSSICVPPTSPAGCEAAGVAT